MYTFTNLPAQIGIVLKIYIESCTFMSALSEPFDCHFFIFSSIFDAISMTSESTLLWCSLSAPPSHPREAWLIWLRYIEQARHITEEEPQPSTTTATSKHHCSVEQPSGCAAHDISKEGRQQADKQRWRSRSRTSGHRESVAGVSKHSQGS